MIAKTSKKNTELSIDQVEAMECAIHFRHIVIATATLNQWALDFRNNADRIRKAILLAKRQHASYILFPEMAVTGYSCEDHFLELDTLMLNHETWGELLSDESLHDIVIDLGVLIHHQGVRYNARLIALDGKILLIRPKTVLANDSNYHEARWFTAWQKTHLEEYEIPATLQPIINQKNAPIGVALLQFNDTCIGIEICEELFITVNSHQDQLNAGAEIICNGSGSHFEINKLKNRLDLVQAVTLKSGCCYVYSNLEGCDGGRLFFDGGSFIFSSGRFLNFEDRFVLCDDGVKVKSTYVDLEEIKSKRATKMSSANYAAKCGKFPRIHIDRSLCVLDIYSPAANIYNEDFFLNTSQHLLRIEEEIIGSMTCYLWDYLRRSRANGLTVFYSGGADSTAVVLLVYYMCIKLFNLITDKKGNNRHFDILKTILKNDNLEMPRSPSDILSKLLLVIYMPMEGHSSNESYIRAKNFTTELGIKLAVVPISQITNKIVEVFNQALHQPSNGDADDGNSVILDFMNAFSKPNQNDSAVAYGNLQARSRNIMGYYISQQCGQRLVLSTGNIDEAVVGFLTKYDASFGDLALIGDLGKDHVYAVLKYGRSQLNLASLDAVIDAVPTAELTPLSQGVTDEEALGLTYEEVRDMRNARKAKLYGPLSMYQYLTHKWLRYPNNKNNKEDNDNKDNDNKESKYTLEEIADKVKLFYRRYAANRHKSTVLPPAPHMQLATADDNRGDFRPHLLNTDFEQQYKHLDRLVQIGLGQKKSGFDFKDGDSGADNDSSFKSVDIDFEKNLSRKL